MKKTLLILIIFCFCPYLARADTSISLPQFPNVEKWHVVSKSRIEIRISDTAVVYLGVDIEYNNPDNDAEFVRIISRHLPMIFVEQEQKDGNLFREAVAGLYIEKEEEEKLKYLDTKIDPLLYVKWEMAVDSATRRKNLSGDVSIWFLGSDGDWKFFKNKKVSIQFLSENIGNGEPRNIFVGRRYQVADVHHVLKIERRDLARLKEVMR